MAAAPAAAAVALLLLSLLAPVMPQQPAMRRNPSVAGSFNDRERTTGGILEGGSGRRGVGRALLEEAAARQKQQEAAKPKKAAAKQQPKPAAKLAAVALPASPKVQRPTLVVYVFHDRDVEHLDRLALFVRLGVQPDDGATYKIVVPTPLRVAQPWERAGKLPELPSNAEYVRVDGSACLRGSASPWAALAAALPQLRAAADASEAVVVIDSEVAGPFFPAYARKHMHWTEAFTSQLSNATKLVGSFISCEGAPLGGSAAAEWRRNPYVMPHAWATDQEGWQLLTSKKAGVLECREDSWDERYHGDAGASLAVLNAGWTLASLMTRYQGIDWRDQANWGCNARIRPDRMGLHDGSTVAAYETVFIPLSPGEARTYQALRSAIKYGEWAQSPTDLESNEYLGAGFTEWSVRGEVALPLQVLRGGAGCFDADHYLKAYPELTELTTSCMGPLCGFDLFDHYMTMGVFTGRQFRFKCGSKELSRQEKKLLAAVSGRACFNHTAYREGWRDLERYAADDATKLWWHYVEYGQFEGRNASFVCGESLYGLKAGFDGSSAEELERERRQYVAKLGNRTSGVPHGPRATPQESLQQQAAHQPLIEPEPQLGSQQEADVESMPM